MFNINNYLNDVIVSENFINLNYQNQLEDLLTSKIFPWFYCAGTIVEDNSTKYNPGIIPDGKNPFQFFNYIDINDVNCKDVIHTILDNITNVFNTNIKIIRLKANFLTLSDSNCYHWPHSDVDDFTSKVVTGLYYVNNSDGPTFLFNEFAPKKNNNVSLLTKIDPEKGKIVFFDSRRFHASSSPVVNDKRIVLNVVFKIPED